MNAFARNLVDNLKRLNAKERDHLMRYAYLGFAGRYVEDTTCWLSDRFRDDLRSHHTELGMSEEARCVFACMDYHLDWLYAALLLACAGKRVTDRGEESAERDMPKIEGLDESLWPVSGGHEDVDLLLVFADGSRVTVLLVEAKGVAGFDKVQLARKAVRAHYILEHSGARGEAWKQKLAFRFVFMAPGTPEIVNICDYVEHHKHSPELTALREKLPAIKQAVGELGAAFMPIPGFPTELNQVKRIHPEAVYESARKKRYGQWQLQRRNVRLAARSSAEPDRNAAAAGSIASGASRNPEADC